MILYMDFIIKKYKKVVTNCIDYFNNMYMYQCLLIHHIKYHTIYQLMISVLIALLFRVFLDLSSVIPSVSAEETILKDGLYILVINKDPNTGQITTSLYLNDDAHYDLSKNKWITNDGFSLDRTKAISHQTFPKPAHAPKSENALFRIDLKSIFSAWKSSWFSSSTKSTPTDIDVNTMFDRSTTTPNGPISFSTNKDELPTKYELDGTYIDFAENDISQNTIYFNNLFKRTVENLNKICSQDQIRSKNIPNDLIRIATYDAVMTCSEKSKWICNTIMDTKKADADLHKRFAVLQVVLAYADLTYHEQKVLLHIGTTMSVISTGNVIGLTKEEIHEIIVTNDDPYIIAYESFDQDVKPSKEFQG